MLNLQRVQLRADPAETIIGICFKSLRAFLAVEPL